MVTYIGGLVQERCNSSASAMEVHFSCTYPSTSKSTLAQVIGLLTDCTKLLPESVLTFHQWGSVALTRLISQEVLKI